MNLLLATAIGTGLGAASFVGLWLTLRHSLRTAKHGKWLAIGQVFRLISCAILLFAMSRDGIGPILSALGGFWTARWHLIHRLGQDPYGK